MYGQSDTLLHYLVMKHDDVIVKTSVDIHNKSSQLIQGNVRRYPFTSNRIPNNYKTFSRLLRMSTASGHWFERQDTKLFRYIYARVNNSIKIYLRIELLGKWTGMSSP